jgi:hypothetical protein
MPLDKPELKSQLEDLFSNPPATEAECAAALGVAMGAYAAAIVPASTTVSVAAAAIPAALAGMSAPGAALAKLESALAAFALAVGGGMGAFVPTPPPGPVGFATLVGFPGTHSAAAQAFADLIDTWMRTGLGTPPFGPVVPWS